MLPQPSERRTTSPPRKAPGLAVEERRQLLTWLDSARANGIDATEDLRSRAWPVAIGADLIGVFREGETMASWLMVAQDGLWTVVAVVDGGVLATRPTLAEALTIIHRPPAGSAFDKHFGAGLLRPD
jgi:hypothetical protein